MMSKLPRSPKGKEKIAFWLLNPASKIESLLLSLVFLLLPTQLGKHFWPGFSIVSGIRIDYLSPTIYVTDVLLLMLFGTFMFRWVKIQRNLRIQIKSKKFLLLIVLVLFFACNIFFSPRPLLSFYGFIKISEFGFLFLYLAHETSYRFQLRFISLLFGISAFFESFLAIAQYLNQGSLNGIFYFFGERTFTGATPGIANASINGELILRPYATFPHPNVLAGYLLISMVLVWGFVLKSHKRWIQTFGATSLIVSSVALLLTFSRIGILLWIFFVFVLLVRLIAFKIKSRKVQLIIGAVGIIVVALISLFPVAHEVFSRFAQTSLSEESVTERTELLSASWIMIQQHPLFGVGLYNFIPALAKTITVKSLLATGAQYFCFGCDRNGSNWFGIIYLAVGSNSNEN
jgi:O-antigen ligase